MDETFSILDKLEDLNDFLIKNEFFDEKSLSELLKDIVENDNEARFERIVRNIETRDREEIDRFAILLRNTDLAKEEFLSTIDECDSSLKSVKHMLLIRFKDLVSTPKACGEVLTVTNAVKIKSTKYGDVYNMTSRPRGFCVVIDNQAFTDPTLAFRSGSRADADRLSDVFSQLGFSVFRYVNKTAAEMELLLKRLSNNEELVFHDALAVIILSHGITDGIYGSDGSTVTVDYILTLFNNRNCRLMINKPKMFFLSACRGHEIDNGTEYYEMDVGEGANMRHLSPPHTLSRASIASVKSQVPTWSDIFVYFSSISGYASLRNISTGSWFGYELAQALAKYAHREHLNDLVTTKVGEALQQRQTQQGSNVMKQAIETQTRGRVKKLYFNPGL